MNPPPFAAGGNWLLAGAAAKVDLVVRLRAALEAAGLRLFAADSSPLSAALHFAHGSVVLPPTAHPDFLPRLLGFCARNDVRVLLPTRDADLLHFAARRDELLAANLWPLVSPLPSVEICLDKIRFHDFCLARGLPVLPRIANPSPADFPCFLRPRVGAAGSGAGPVPSAEALRALHGPPPWPDLLLQPICSAPEYTVDALFAPDGSPAQWIARERIRVKAGESTVGRTVAIPALDDLVRSVARALPLFGHVTLQAFHSPASGPFLVEINPRFGGGAALGIEAGLDSPARLVALAQGNLAEFLRPRPPRIGLAMLRYSRDIFLENLPTP